MDPDKIDYPALLQNALRDVVRRALRQAAEHGLPGEHHFYLGFRTSFPGVEVPRFLRDQYPEEMTVILQNQYWGLEVTEESFAVLLSFGGSRQRISVPFAALTAFADPAADFGLRFDPNGAVQPAPAAEPADEPSPPVEPRPAKTGEVVRFDPSRRR